MKLSKSKLALAKVINENGGWVDGANFSSQDCDGWVYHFTTKPTIDSGSEVWKHKGCIGKGHFKAGKIKNWHQTILSREEYYQAYPMTDDDGWIEWMGGECPVGDGVLIDVKKVDGSTELAAHDPQDRIWSDLDHRKCITAYRLHKPWVKPEFCESVMRSIPEPESKPTIERLAHDYRNAKEYAARLQKDADEAKDKSEAIKELLIKSGAEIGIVIYIGKAGDEIEYKIGDKWFLVSDLKSAGWTDEQLSDYPSR